MIRHEGPVNWTTGFIRPGRSIGELAEMKTPSVFQDYDISLLYCNDSICSICPCFWQVKSSITPSHENRGEQPEFRAAEVLIQAHILSIFQPLCCFHALLGALLFNKFSDVLWLIKKKKSHLVKFSFSSRTDSPRCSDAFCRRFVIFVDVIKWLNKIWIGEERKKNRRKGE